MSSILEDEAFKGKAVIEQKKIEEFRIKGLGEVEDDLKEYEMCGPQTGQPGEGLPAVVALGGQHRTEAV